MSGITRNKIGRETHKAVLLGVTDFGRITFIGTGFVLLASLVIPAFGVLAALVCLEGIALLAGFCFRFRVSVDGHLPRRVIAGDVAYGELILENHSLLPAYNLSLSFKQLPKQLEIRSNPQVIPRLAPGETVKIKITIHATRRGEYRFEGPVCYSTFPFNLYQFGTCCSNQATMLVLPSFYLLHNATSSPLQGLFERNTQIAGGVGTSPEYIGSRPYLAGDQPKDIDARAWARLCAPVVKEYQDEAHNNLALVLDTILPPIRLKLPSSENLELEAAIILCASLAFTFSRNETHIEWLLAGNDLHVFPSGHGLNRFERVHELLAAVKPAESHRPQIEEPILTDKFKQVSRAVFILLHWDEQRRQYVNLAVKSGCSVEVFVMEKVHKNAADCQPDHSGYYRIHWLNPEQLIYPPDERRSGGQILLDCR